MQLTSMCNNLWMEYYPVGQGFGCVDSGFKIVVLAFILAVSSIYLFQVLRKWQTVETPSRRNNRRM